MWISRYWLPVSIWAGLIGIAIGSGPLIGLAGFLFVAGNAAGLWSRHVLDRVRYERIVPETRAFPGEWLTLTLRLVNDKLLPVPWIEVKDAVPEGIFPEEKHQPIAFPGYVHLVRSTHLAWYERINWPLQFKAPVRGYYRLGPARLTSGDIFGFYPAERQDERFESIIVYPKLYTLPELRLPPERPFGELKGRERIFEDPQRIAGLRDYRPGDPMRRIDWKATARRQSLQSKVYEPSSTLHMLIALNVDTMHGSWEGYLPETMEQLLSVAGSVAKYGFEAGFAVGLVANGSYMDSDRPMRVPVGRHSDQLMRVLEALAVIGPLTLSRLENVIDAEAQRFPFGATLVVVTSRMDPPLAASLRRVRDAGHTVVVLSLAEGEFEEDLTRIQVHNLSHLLQAPEAAASGNGARQAVEART
jgi:uncharacterized protein (DUF58 family)